jgi:hypothetical protein
MALDDATLRAQALQTYERGRLGAALRAAWFVPLLLAASLWGCGAPSLAIAGGAAVLVLSVALHWRGGVWAEARAAGLLAGLVPFALPLVLRALGHPCSPGECDAFFGTAVAGGLLAGVAIGVRAPDRRAAAVALLLAGLIGSLGCALAGVMGLAAMAGALVVTSVPVFLLAHARSRY